MDKYKINYIFEEAKDINDIFIEVLKKELKKYILMISKNSELPYLSIEGGKNC